MQDNAMAIKEGGTIKDDEGIQTTMEKLFQHPAVLPPSFTFNPKGWLTISFGRHSHCATSLPIFSTLPQISPLILYNIF